MCVPVVNNKKREKDGKDAAFYEKTHETTSVSPVPFPTSFISFPFCLRTKSGFKAHNAFI